MEIASVLVQIATILGAARVVGRLFRAMHQPQVIGEMVAGILLGPSLLGWLAPAVSAALFPPASLSLLTTISQIGLLMFMFLVGLELNPAQLSQRRHAAVVTSHASIVIPFLLGSLLAVYLYPRLSTSDVRFAHFSVFLGIAMSVTAFPVLARILTERKLLRTEVGALAVTCAAVDDVTAWCLLAGVVLFVRATEATMPLWGTILGSAAYVVAMIVVVRPRLRALEAWYRARGRIDQDMLAVVFLLMLASAWITDTLGIHALFGAFLMGAVMPKADGLVRALTGRLEDVTVVLLLPLFFAVTGLRTSIALVSGGEMWFYCGLIMAAAIAGKLGGAMAAAHCTGLSWREAGAVGILMNTRGLMELVVVNIGLDLGILSPALFTMLVLMALLTTFMTTPLLDLYYLRRRQADPVPTAADVVA